jgi:hypothetical protein
VSELARKRMTSDEFIAWVQHYLILKTENRTVVHHQRGADRIILTRSVRKGPILQELPGTSLANCFPPGAA